MFYQAWKRDKVNIINVTLLCVCVAEYSWKIYRISLQRCIKVMTLPQVYFLLFFDVNGQKIHKMVRCKNNEGKIHVFLWSAIIQQVRNFRSKMVSFGLVLRIDVNLFFINGTQVKWLLCSLFCLWYRFYENLEWVGLHFLQRNLLF